MSVGCVSGLFYIGNFMLFFFIFFFYFSMKFGGSESLPQRGPSVMERFAYTFIR